ncbi:MAG: PLP-dependent aspartate aminotransferase family protein [Treponema sp.]|jgi:cystathionine gamma-synthase|nr:PLP-dependent aspartate aminotransferase family protein [Treponema sp.]
MESVLVHGATPFDPCTGAVSTPIFQSATFRHSGLGDSTGYDYSRVANPTRDELEKTVALIEHGAYGLAFSSGMGAISALVKLFNPGDHIVVSEDLYGGTYRLFNDFYRSYGYSFSWVDTSDPDLVKKALRLRTRALFIETPSNPMMKVTDIRRAADLVHEVGGLLVTDNTFLSPWFQNPLDLGSDFVIHSGTKYMGGHNDTLSGFIVHSDKKNEAVLRNVQKSEGASLSPFDSWLVLRGLKTLGVRMEKHNANALAVAEWLRRQDRVEKVFYTGFEDHPQYELSGKQARGYGGMLSFYLKNPLDVPVILRSLSLILFAESLGGVESLITYPLVQTHSAIPEAMRLAAGVNDRLLRLSAGIEDSKDIIADLDAALSRCKEENGE